MGWFNLKLNAGLKGYVNNVYRQHLWTIINGDGYTTTLRAAQKLSHKETL